MRATCGAILLACAASLAGAGAIAADRHVGVASCAGSTCHGATRPFPDAKIRQDEYFTWQRKDRHAQAFETLGSERSARIARSLGIGDASQSPRCLACHADTVAPGQRGARWLLTDGVGCEACHGAAERWLAPHVRGFADAGARRHAGMTALEDPSTRAAVCLACHQGDDAHPMTHAIMAAGHPPLLFELDTFQVLQPAHYEADADYAAREGAPDPYRNWIAGQLEAVQRLLDGIAGPRFERGLYPELAFFDCDACHHSMRGERARPNRSAGLAAGEVPFADASFEMIDAWLAQTAPAEARRWRSLWTALHAARPAGARAVQARAREMLAWVRATLLPSAQGSIDAPMVRRLLRQIVSDAREPRGGDFAYAQQTAMASLVMMGALHARNVEPPAAARAAVDRVYAAVRDPDRFSVREWRAAIDALAAQLGT